MALEISTLLFVNKIVIILINIIGFWLATATFFINKSRPVNKYYFFFAVFLIFWIDLKFLITFSPLLFSMPYMIYAALLGQRFVYAVLSLFFISFYYFSVHFPREGKRSPFFDKIYVAVWVVLFLLALSPFIVNGVPSPATNTNQGELIYYYAMISSIIICAYNIFSKNYYLTNEEKNKVHDFVRGAIIFGAFQTIPLSGVQYGSIIGQYSLIFLLGFAAYAINQKEIFEVKVILVEILLGTIGTILLVLPFLTDNIFFKVSHYILFILFCVFFDLIMKSILKEFREKEFLEKKVEQRTAEVEEAKKSLEETNAVLEVRVRARTLELERLNETLEEKVRERTMDLQEKMKELERFNRLSVGRELKMIELKNRIRNMEQISENNSQSKTRSRAKSGRKKTEEDKTKKSEIAEKELSVVEKIADETASLQ